MRLSKNENNKHSSYLCFGFVDIEYVIRLTYLLGLNFAYDTTDSSTGYKQRVFIYTAKIIDKL